MASSSLPRTMRRGFLVSLTSSAACSSCGRFAMSRAGNSCCIVCASRSDYSVTFPADIAWCSSAAFRRKPNAHPDVRPSLWRQAWSDSEQAQRKQEVKIEYRCKGPAHRAGRWLVAAGSAGTVAAPVGRSPGSTASNRNVAHAVVGFSERELLPGATQGHLIFLSDWGKVVAS